MANDEGGEDIISSLPNDLIHDILSFSDAKVAVQTSVLSKRWKLAWTTLPCISFTRNKLISEAKFVDNFLSHRNQEYNIVTLKLCFTIPPHRSLVFKFISYAITHNVEDLSVDIPGSGRHPINLSILSSTSLKKLTLCICGFGLLKSDSLDPPGGVRTLYGVNELSESDFWDLPALTTLQLTLCHWKPNKLPESYLTCLPSLQTLSLGGFELPETISLPGLTSLRLARCNLPSKAWDIPALLTLILEDVVFSKDENKFLCALVNLPNLALVFRTKKLPDCCIDIPNLVNLEIRYYPATSISRLQSGDIVVLSQKIRNFSSVGIFPVIFKHLELENVNIKLRDSSSTYYVSQSIRMLKYYRRFAYLFQGLGSARILALDCGAIQALSAVSRFFKRSPSPFNNLKYVKVPEGNEESIISANLKPYLLGRSPKATVVTTLPRVRERCLQLPDKVI